MFYKKIYNKVKNVEPTGQLWTEVGYEESLEQEIRRKMATGEPIKAEASGTYFCAKGEFNPSCDIRTNKLDLILETINAGKQYTSMKKSDVELKNEVSNETTE